MRPARSRPSRNLHAVALAVVGFVSLQLTGPQGAGPSELTLFDAPRGSWLGTIRSDAEPVVLEERDGWRRVRVEGWIPAPGTQGAGIPAGGGAAPASAEAPSGATIRGILPSTASFNPADEGMIVFLVTDLQGFDREHAKAGEECSGQVADRRERIVALRKDLDRALSSTDNFRNATGSNDRIRAQLAEAEQSLQGRLGACRRRAAAIVMERAVRRTAPDAAGRFELTHLAPGRYRVIVMDPAGASRASFSFECSVPESGTREIDPRADKSPVDLYWGLEAAASGTASRS